MKFRTVTQVTNDIGELIHEHLISESVYIEPAPEPPPVEPTPEPPPVEPTPEPPPLPPYNPPPYTDPDGVWNPPPTPSLADGRVVRKTLDKSWKQAMMELGSAGGTLLIAPGVHETSPEDYVFTKGWSWLSIRGELDPMTGERPLIRHNRNAAGETINVFLGWSGPNGNLWIEDMRFHGAGSEVIACGTGKYSTESQKVVLNKVELAYAGHHGLMMGHEFSGNEVGEARKHPVNDELWIRESDFHHSGYTHNHYCDRIAKEVVVSSRFYSPRGLSGHAFKSIARDLTVLDCEISNAMLDGSIDTNISHWSFGKTTPADMYLGAVPVSIVAGQRGLFARNRVTHRTHALYNTGGFCVAQQGRHNIHGLEVPDPLDLTGEFYDPAFWASAEYWIMRFMDNEYIVLGDSKDMPAQMIYQNQGTYPVYSGFPITPIPNVPAEWFERSRSVCSGDKIRGFTKRGADLYDSGPYFHNLNPTDNPVGRFEILTDPVEF